MDEVTADELEALRAKCALLSAALKRAEAERETVHRNVEVLRETLERGGGIPHILRDLAGRYLVTAAQRDSAAAMLMLCQQKAQMCREDGGDGARALRVLATIEADAQQTLHAIWRLSPGAGYGPVQERDVAITTLRNVRDMLAHDEPPSPDSMARVATAIDDLLKVIDR